MSNVFGEIEHTTVKVALPKLEMPSSFSQDDMWTDAEEGRLYAYLRRNAYVGKHRAE